MTTLPSDGYAQPAASSEAQNPYLADRAAPAPVTASSPAVASSPSPVYAAPAVPTSHEAAQRRPPVISLPGGPGPGSPLSNTTPRQPLPSPGRAAASPHRGVSPRRHGGDGTPPPPSPRVFCWRPIHEDVRSPPPKSPVIEEKVRLHGAPERHTFHSPSTQSEAILIFLLTACGKRACGRPTLPPRAASKGWLRRSAVAASPGGARGRVSALSLLPRRACAAACRVRR